MSLRCYPSFCFVPTAARHATFVTTVSYLARGAEPHSTRSRGMRPIPCCLEISGWRQRLCPVRSHSQGCPGSLGTVPSFRGCSPTGRQTSRPPSNLVFGFPCLAEERAPCRSHVLGVLQRDAL